MQLASCKRLLGMDDSSHESKNSKHQIDGSLEIGPSPIREDEDESKYPPLKTVILSMLSIYLAFFLSALVSLLIELQRTRRLTIRIGSHDHWCCHTRYIFCVSQFPIGKIYVCPLLAEIEKQRKLISAVISRLSTPQNGHSQYWLPSSKSDRLCVLLLPHLWHSLSAEQSQALEAPDLWLEHQ